MSAVDIITIDDVHDHLNMTDATEGDDLELAVHITAASELVEQMVGPVVIRQFTDLERTGPRLALDQRPVVELLAVAPTFGAGAALDVAGLVVNRETGTVRQVSGSYLLGGPWDVTYTAGRAETVAEVPDALGLACRVIVAHLWETQRAATLGPQSDDFTPLVQGSGFAIPYRARDLMAPYRTVVVA